MSPSGQSLAVRHVRTQPPRSVPGTDKQVEPAGQLGRSTRQKVKQRPWGSSARTLPQSRDWQSEASTHGSDRPRRLGSWRKKQLPRIGSHCRRGEQSESSEHQGRQISPLHAVPPGQSPLLRQVSTQTPIGPSVAWESVHTWPAPHSSSTSQGSTQSLATDGNRMSGAGHPRETQSVSHSQGMKPLLGGPPRQRAEASTASRSGSGPLPAETSQAPTSSGTRSEATVAPGFTALPEGRGPRGRARRPAPRTALDHRA